MKKRGWGIGDYLAWLILALIVLWLILKVLGFINTPLWLEYSPLFGAIYLAGWAMHKLDRATEDIQEIKEEVKGNKEDLLSVRNEISSITEKCEWCKEQK